MTRPPPTATAQPDRLRAAAEAQAVRAPAGEPAHPATELAHELQVHRIELEMQNEELRAAQVALEAARDRYVDLYDFAPVGYLTLDTNGLVSGANLTGARLLGIERKRLVGRRFARCVAPEDRDRWLRHALLLGRDEGPGRIELAMLGRSGTVFHAQLDAMRTQMPGEPPMLRITLTDISERKRAELFQRRAVAANAGREADRRRVALQLHEDLGQRLWALNLDLHSLRSAERRPAQHARMGAMLADIDAALATVRRISADLRPAMLDDLGLNAAIEWLVHDTSERLGVAVTLKQDAIEPPLDEASAVAIYRLIQDVLDRLIDRRPTSEVTIGLRRRPPGLVVSLQGGGLNRRDSLDSAHDTTPLNERAHALGAEVALESDGSAGERLTLRVPLEPAEGGHHLRLTEAAS
jgi:PAS domain S-box-containing protein